MPPLALDCPLCCSETFPSKDSLRYHLLGTIDNLHCRICDSRCADLLELIEHLDKNCFRSEEVLVKTEDTSSQEDFDEDSQMADDPDTELGNENEVHEDAANSPDNLYSCLMCNITFSSIEEHLEKYHEGEEVLLETDEVDEENEEEECVLEEQIIEEESPKNRSFTDDDNNYSSKAPPNPIIEKYLFSNVTTKRPQTRRCCVPTCNARCKPGPRHRFPKSEPEIFKIWLDIIRPLGFEDLTQDELYRKLVVCNEHFTPDCFVLGSRRGLLRTAVPTLNLPKQEIGFEGPTVYDPNSEPVKKRSCDKYIKFVDDVIAGNEKNQTYSAVKRAGPSTKLTGNEPKSKGNPNIQIHSSISLAGPSSRFIQSTQTPKGEVRVLSEKEIEAVKDKSLISEILRCPMCTLKFPNQAHYEKHKCTKRNVIHGTNKPKKAAPVRKFEKPIIKEGKYKCTFCQKGYKVLTDLQDHMKSHLIEDEDGNITANAVAMSLHICEICNTKFPTIKSLRLHGKMHKPVPEKEVEPPVDYNIMGETEMEDGEVSVKHETFQCPECDKEFDVKYRAVHMKVHDEETEYNCNICNKKFHSQTNLEMHVKAHADAKKFSCSYCKKPFNTYEALQEHTKNECKLQKQYECQYCGRRFSKPHEKVKHERIHTGEKPHICQICGKAFRVSYCLTLHMRTHTGIRPYMCNQCGKRFKSNGVYMHHLKTHSEVRNYKCPYCAKAFKTAVQLSSHKNSHTKPFSCTDCNRPFASLYAVRAHMATHKKENNLKYDCWLCGATYARSFALKDHMNSVHIDYSITGETANGETVAIHGEQTDVEFEQQVEDEESEAQIEQPVEMIEA